MSVNIGINGFGRIGRLMFRQAILDPQQRFKIRAINDTKDIKYLMYLLKYDSVHGKYQESLRKVCQELFLSLSKPHSPLILYYRYL